MNATTSMDYGTLNWVKAEIDETLKQARHTLEAFAANSKDSAQIRFCANHLHQVRGTLQMIELYGPALIAEEMELLANGLLNDEIAQRDSACELLMRAILQLPDYLERLQTGHSDNPLVLLPLLNDLRATRGQNLLSEGALFAPDLSVTKAARLEISSSAAPDIRAVARKLRPAYQLGLVNWHRNQRAVEPIKQLAKVLNRLEESSSADALVQLWWVAGGVLEALRDGSLQASVAIELLMGQIDRQIKRLIDVGEQAWVANPPRELVTNLLYYVSRAQPAGARVSELRQAFHLTELLPGEAQTDQEEQALTTPNLELMRTVAAVIKEDLAKVKDGLDIFVRSEIPLIADLLPLVDTLSQTADTLGMLGMGIPRTTIMDQVAVIRDMAQGKLEFSDAALMDLAGALLRVEAALDDLVAMQDHKEVMGGGGAAARDGAAAGMALELGAAGDAVTDAKSAFSAEAEDLFNDVEYRQLLSAVVREAKADMSRVKDDITGFITVPMQHNLLIDVPRVMTRIMGSLSMLAQTRAAQLMDACRKRIVDDLVEKKIVPAPAQLDTLAEVISGIEYYLEALNEGRSDRDSILDQAEQRMEQLDFALAAITPLATASGAEPAGADDAVSEPGHAQIYDRAEMPQAGQTDAAQHHQYDAALIQPPEPVNPLSGAAPLSLFNIALSAPSEEIDEEIIQIFLEEADEELASIAVQLPQWQHNQADKNALTTVRRSFHTLKGSGRMVGAMVVGEFAWAFENMLNRVIDGTVPVKPEMFELIQQAQLALPQLIEQFKGGGPPAMDVQALVDQAKAIIQANQPAAAAGPSSAPPLPSPGVSVPAVEPVSRMADVASLAEPVAQAAQSAANAETMLPDVDGVLETASGAPEDITAAVGTETVCEIAPALAPQPAANDSATPDTVLPVPEAGVEQLYLPPALKSTPRIDLVLLEIFSKEAAGHLAAIQGFTDRCAVQAEDCLVTEALVRTLHTLHGSAGMAGVAAIAEPSGLLEKYAKRLSARQAMIGAEVANMLRDSVVFIGDMLTALYDANLPQPDGSALLTTINALYEAEVASHSGLTQEQERVAQEEWVERQTSGLALPDKDADIVEIFLEEGREILDATEIILQHWMAEQHNHKFLEELQRELHTLKGGARMAGLSAIGDLSHSMEAVITGIVEGYLPLSPRLPELMQQTQDRLLQMLDHASVNLPIAPAQDLIALIEQLMEVKPEARQALPDNSLPAVSPAPEMPAPEDSIAPVGEDSSIRVEDEGADDQAAFMEEDADEVDQAERMERGTDEADQVEADQRRVSLRPQHEQVRVRADLLDSLVNFAAEISISRARIEQQIGSYKYNLEEMDQIVARLRGQLRKLEIETEAQILFRYAETASRAEDEFDPLEFDRFSHIQQLSRSLLESVSDLASIETLLQNLTRESETLLLQQSRVNTDLHEGLMRARMVQFAVLMPRMRRIVRQTCQELGKHVELRVLGAEGEIDRTVLDRIVPSLEHMLRNAIDHGIEPAKARRAAGKPEAGLVAIRTEREGSEIVIKISDDGGGLNLPAIRAKAIERGLVQEGAEITDNDVMQFILEPGFTTAQHVTQISGRGIGMDVVNNELKQLSGSLHISSTAGVGTTFTVRLPLTLSINRALLVHVGEELYAIPLTNIERIVQAGHKELEQGYQMDSPSYTLGERVYHLFHLGTVLGGTRPHSAGTRKKAPLLLARSHDHRVALQVDALLGSREIVVKSVGPQISTVRGITGATILGDGRVVLILDINALVRTGVSVANAVREAISGPLPGKLQITAMVVDDSITVRKVTSRLLERHNIQVLTAKDGVDAVALLQEHIPDVMLLDIEMPRMDGYELATHMRNEERLKHIPIIMITSRTGEKHRERAMQIGVNKYMGKPYQESELLENISALVGERIGVMH